MERVDMLDSLDTSALMKLSNVLRILAIGALLSSVTARSGFADVVETKNGARLVGKVLSVDGVSVSLSTDYAGTIKIKQGEVVSVSTEEPLNVRLASGTVLKGTVTGSGGGGAIAIAGPDGSINTTVDKIAATWAPGGTDPALLALARNWAYEAAVDVTGKTGNSEQLGTAFSFRATLEGIHDKLQFYTAYDRQVTAGTKSSDQLKAGVDYQANFSEKKLWYVRDEAGFDRVKLIEFSNIAAFGVGYHVIKRPVQTLDLRIGLSHRFESYQRDPKTHEKADSLNSAGLDFGLEHHYQFANAALVNRLAIVPAFENFSNFVLTHESFLELPMANPDWKLRIGVANDYNSKPPKNHERLDTTYFTRLVLGWK